MEETQAKARKVRSDKGVPRTKKVDRNLPVLVRVKLRGSKETQEYRCSHASLQESFWVLKYQQSVGRMTTVYIALSEIAHFELEEPLGYETAPFNRPAAIQSMHEAEMAAPKISIPGRGLVPMAALPHTPIQTPPVQADLIPKARVVGRNLGQDVTEVTTADGKSSLVGASIS